MNRRRPARQKQPLDVENHAPAAKLGPEIKAKIGQQLRIMYGEIVGQGVPDRFVDILRGLDGPDDESSQNGSS
jgi:Anti-sigma factor NepR